MNTKHSQQDLSISLQDFQTSGWKEAIASQEGYYAMYSALKNAAQNAIEQKRFKHYKVLHLLADICSMLLSPSSPNEPFKPFMVSNGQRSIIPNDLLDADIQFLTEIIDYVDNHWLKARLSDLLWLLVKPRNVAFALGAIDAYRSIPLKEDKGILKISECWSRAISLARMLKTGAGDRLQQIEESIISTFEAVKQEQGPLGVILANLLKSNKLGQSHQISVANKLEALAREFDDKGELRPAREYFSTAAKWFQTIPNQAKAAEMTVAVAENLVKEAVACNTSNRAHKHAVAMSLYENAIQTYRMVPKNERATYRVEKRILELRTLMNTSGEQVQEEMTSIQSPSIDITNIVKEARKSVTGQSIQQALLRFANLHHGASIETLREDVLQNHNQQNLRTLIAATTISHDGRVIAKKPAMSFAAELTADDELAIRAEMIKEHTFLIGLVVHSTILPALEVLLLEHRLQKIDFITLAENSPIVPKDRSYLFGKALFAGYERDFVTALHILIPQMEHLVRIHLKQAGANTTNIDKDGIQNENGMSTLLELPEAEQIFGKDLTFELSSLFCDAFGPNLRNKLAHGLLDENECQSVYAIYAWWLALRLTVNTWWNSATSATEPQEINDDQGPEAELIEEQGAQ